MTAAFQFRLLILASQIQDITSKIVENLIENQLQEPTFDVSSEPLLLTPENVRLKEDLNDTAQDLLRLVNGPKTDLSTSICTIYDLAAWQVAFEFRLFEAILENGAASLHDIARKVGVDEDRVRRILKILATDRMFEEVEKDHFKHTSRSVLYARYQQVRDLVHYQ
jgi:predicted transcriptional regulator